MYFCPRENVKKKIFHFMSSSWSEISWIFIFFLQKKNPSILTVLRSILRKKKKFMIFISGYLFWRSKFQKHVWRLVCPKIAKNSISNQPLFNYLKVATNNLRYSEKCSSAEKVSKIDFCWSCFLDFYGKIIKIDVFLMIFPTSRLFRSSCMAVHGCTRIEKIQNRQKWAKTYPNYHRSSYKRVLGRSRYP